jgi:hypothetical protein
MMHDDIMHEGIYDALIHYHFDTKHSKTKNYHCITYNIYYYIKNDFTNNYIVFPHMHTFSH